MNQNMNLKLFSDINLYDPFFDSLKSDYPGFENWFQRKINENERAFVQYNLDKNIEGFLYLKTENYSVSDVKPMIKANKILKVGTFKIDAHGTKLGERFIKVIMDTAVSEKVDVCYVTIYPKHTPLINLVEQFGFKKHGIKGDDSNPENVYVKYMNIITGNINYDYPLINTAVSKKYLLSIYPQYHSVMFPDSILTTENRNLITDVSYTNSIHKIYVCRMKDAHLFQYGDILIVYRTAEYPKSAEYSSVATSICVVEEVKSQNSFASFEDFYNYSCQYSVFDEEDLKYWYNKGNCIAIKMTYNAALSKRIVRHDLINKVGLCRSGYWGILELDDSEFNKIITLGMKNTSILK